MPRALNTYEIDALHNILAWERREPGWIGKAFASLMGAANDRMSDMAVMQAVDNAVRGCVSLLQDGAAYTVRPEAIFAEYRQDGRSVYCSQDIALLPLQEVDVTVGRLALKYKSLAATEGAVEGATSIGGPQFAVPALLAGIPALMGLALRATCEYAVYHGFDIELEQERVYALQAMNAASLVQTGGKLVVLGQLAKTAHDIAVRKTWAELNRTAFAQIVGQLGRSCGVRVTKAKLGQAIPLAGMFIAGGFNAWFLANVCETAGMLYRKRFLARTSGDPHLL